MQIQINGEMREVPDATTVTALVESLEMKSDRVAIERNQEIVPRSEWHTTVLRPGDKLEVVHFVGGGVDRSPQKLLLR